MAADDKTTETSAVPLTTDAAGAASGSAAAQGTGGKEEAKTRFNSALDEAKAGAQALRGEAATRARGYKEEARAKGSEYAEQAKAKGGELAVEGKHKASEALVSLSRMVAENAAKIDDNFGPKYGDHARNAARGLQDAAAHIDTKSYDELGDEARQFVKKNPGLSVGMAAFGGYVFARLFRR
ncbi:hypothetical protein [Alteriqipengyuania lutimaris]|uniref:DUF883 family protein n=1 Tax=Alteriqipengyuania lutimaris TaxID=1538146 RepID=A0A395LLQ4_9SPHN|nr:hypothetical protein [Alteriqipengyuania lutimaris]MBB3032969.1 ElaB/YqjD/DUF883 family membrane-anchored ribosome-binding protein [Alteriqipengyuania lutimaris]RDS77953.1 hypothetical protein DL238_10315 [Alteriqipengyuania lutimaris]